MTMTANGLAKLIEELGELSQVCGKKLAYYHTDEHPDGAGSLRERMQAEMGDVFAAISFVMDKLSLDEQAISDRAQRKLALFEKWDADDSNGTYAVDAVDVYDRAKQPAAERQQPA